MINDEGLSNFDRTRWDAVTQRVLAWAAHTHPNSAFSQQLKVDGYGRLCRVISPSDIDFTGNLLHHSVL